MGIRLDISLPAVGFLISGSKLKRIKYAVIIMVPCFNDINHSFSDSPVKLN